MENNEGHTTSHLVAMQGVSKIYEIGNEQVRALDEVHVFIEHGEFVSIVGPSGSGKSTLMNIMGCLDMYDEGEYILNGVPVVDYSELELAKLRNHTIGFIFQGFNLIDKMTARENIELPLIYQRVREKERKRRVDEVVNRVGLEHRVHHRPSELSGGQQQRVAIARALATQPSLILADEPTGNLDSKTGHEIMKLFHEINQEGNTIVLITHDVNLASQANRKIAMLDGRIQEVSS